MKPKYIEKKSMTSLDVDFEPCCKPYIMVKKRSETKGTTIETISSTWMAVLASGTVTMYKISLAIA